MQSTRRHVLIVVATVALTGMIGAHMAAAQSPPPTNSPPPVGSPPPTNSPPPVATQPPTQPPETDRPSETSTRQLRTSRPRSTPPSDEPAGEPSEPPPASPQASGTAPRIGADDATPVAFAAAGNVGQRWAAWWWLLLLIAVLAVLTVFYTYFHKRHQPIDVASAEVESLDLDPQQE